MYFAIVVFLLIYILFPDNAFHGFLIKWTYKLLLGGSKQRW